MTVMTAVPTPGADLQFNAELHEYRTPSGLVVPSVTQILKDTGVATDFEEIANRSEKSGVAVEYRRALGTAVHADCHAFDDHDLDLDAVHTDVRPFVDAWILFRANTSLRPVARERRVFHSTEFYCGTLDGIFEREPDRRRVLVDIKIGDPFHAGAHLQTAGYQLAYQHEFPEELIHERWAVRLIPGRVVPYDITAYTDWKDINRFRAVLTTYHEQPSRRSRRIA